VARLRFFDVIRNPAQLILAAYTALILIGTALLLIPAATVGKQGLAVRDALFMSTSASTVTGLATVSVDRFSHFGELVLLLLVQVGGFGIMTIGSVFALLAAHRLGLRQRQLAQAEIGAIEHGELRRLILAIAKITFLVEGTLAVILFLGFWVGNYESFWSAAYSGLYNSVTSFNNAGLSNYPDSMVRFANNAWITLPLTFGFVLGGLGFPVFVEAIRRWRQHNPGRDPDRGSMKAIPWSVHTKVTLAATAVLLIVGPVAVMVLEWTNAKTIGEFDFGDKLLASWFQGVTPRTAGFNTVDIGQLNETTQLVISTLMFIGAGSASTGGGIKVTTFAILGFVMWSEVRGRGDVNLFHRRLPTEMIRQALTVALLSVGLVVGASIALMIAEDLDLSPAVFEITSAFGTVGLSTGITSSLSTIGDLIVIVIMLAGRIGPVTFVTALALTDHRLAYRYPEERPIIG
jgi:potassium uptake TrkH family protein